MGDSEEWKQVLGEIEYYVSLRREIGFPKSTPERHEYDRKPFKKLIRKAKKSLGCGKVCPQKQNLKSADSDYDKKWRTRQSLFVSREFEYLDLLVGGRM